VADYSRIRWPNNFVFSGRFTSDYAIQAGMIKKRCFPPLLVRIAGVHHLRTAGMTLAVELEFVLLPQARGILALLCRCTAQISGAFGRYLSSERLFAYGIGT
jgi:hypothetical protein